MVEFGKTSVAKLVSEAQESGYSLEGLIREQVKIGRLADEISLRQRLGGLVPDESEMDRVVMLTAAWFKIREVQA